MTKTAPAFYKQLLESFPFTPTNNQNILLQQLSEFIFSTGKNELFILKGYAGTGKTTSISAVVTNLWKTGKKSVMLAPTGRAAKVISNYANRPAYTVHKKIYHPRKAKNGGINFVLQTNKHTHTLFIVDEASMISDATSNSKLFENGSLLDDLVQYVYSGIGCKLIFIGDTAQLPPVKLDLSPALNPRTLALNYNKDIATLELDEVMRQHEDSGILVNATHLRQQLLDGGAYDFKFNLNFPDVVRLTDGYDIEDALSSAYDDAGVENTAFIVRSNKRANLYNNQIRSKIRSLDNEIATGDFVMVVKNNYFWLKSTSEAGFIANGDICEIIAIRSTKELYGFRFAEVTLRMIDYKNQAAFDTVLLLDTLGSNTPSLSYEESNRLYQEVAKDFAHEKSSYKRLLAIKNNPYFNALQIKFAYAMTCHKSQGGQWKTVFIEQPYLPEGVNRDFIRWLYTAVTRAQEKLYLINFKNEFFYE